MCIIQYEDLIINTKANEFEKINVLKNCSEITPNELIVNRIYYYTQKKNQVIYYIEW